ncbi:phospho-N-acetylmuramoyl-pentapeptide-transferase [Clostridia bacterium]|nr:phospho-N-acetylmuramoyl-pentapeptide-transferase [Clostridia bacterium]
MSEKILIPVAASFLITALLGPILIPALRRLKVGQTEREELKSHLQKAGTPTMGGLMILAGIIITSIFYVKSDPKILPILFVTIGFGIIGFLDDYLKVVLKRSDGLLAWQKMLGQILITGIFLVYMVKFSGISLNILLPFTGGVDHGLYLHLGWLAVPVLFLAMIGTVNGANFTDGLDGLASSVTLLIATFFTVVAIGTKSGIEPITCAVVGALLGFLLFNVHPASIFMGDTGSLALGGFVASAAYMMQMPLFILIVALVYWVELLSVMLQVVYFKMTKGGRIFLMTPIHHHFEKNARFPEMKKEMQNKGKKILFSKEWHWSETRIVAVFSIVTALLCLAALAGLS